MQSVPSTTKVVSSNPALGEMYSIQHYVIKFVSDLRQVGGFLRFPPNFVEFKIMMCELCSIKDFIVHWVLPLLCLFETIQYALCHRKFSYMINQKFMKLCTLQDPNMKMCTLVGYPGPSNFLRIMSLKVVFQICFGSIKMMGTRRVLVLRSGQLSYSIYVSMRDSCVQHYL